MDPVSHVAFGRALIAFARRDPARRGLIAAAVLGSLSPDADAVLMPVGWDLYLRIHEIGTHSIVGTIACALATGAIVRLFVRGGRFQLLALAGWIGAVSHVFLDLVSSARLRIAWPISDRYVTLPLVAMADPLVLAPLVVGLTALLIARAPQRAIASVTLTVVAAVLTVKSVLAFQAVTAYEAATRHHPAVQRVIEAKWGTLEAWTVSDRAEDLLRVWRVDARRSAARLLFAWPLVAESQTVLASRSLATVRNFLRAHDLGFATTIPNLDGNQTVLWSDIRYCWDASATGAPSVDPIVKAGAARIGCALWFGAEFDADERPLLEIVRIGGLTQTRAASR
jgi:membrane-bound metal-dependent hydrolase YbcI (DUF457 family)